MNPSPEHSLSRRVFLKRSTGTVLIFGLGAVSGLASINMGGGGVDENGWSKVDVACLPYESSSCYLMSVTPGIAANDTENAKTATRMCAEAQGKTVDNMVACELRKGDEICGTQSGKQSKPVKNPAGQQRWCLW
jgi:hypothetical protein